MAAVGFDWIFFAIVAPWPIFAIFELMRPSGSGVQERREPARPGIGARQV